MAIAMCPEYWKKVLDGAQIAMRAEHQRRLTSDPVYKASFDKFASDMLSAKTTTG